MTGRPRMPLWAAVAIPAAAYALRSAIRGSLRPDLPEDVVVLVALLGLIALSVAAAAQRRRDELPDEMQGRDHGQGRERQQHEIGTYLESPRPGSARPADDCEPSAERDTETRADSPAD